MPKFQSEIIQGQNQSILGMYHSIDSSCFCYHYCVFSSEIHIIFPILPNFQPKKLILCEKSMKYICVKTGNITQLIFLYHVKIHLTRRHLEFQDQYQVQNFRCLLTLYRYIKIFTNFNFLKQDFYRLGRKITSYSKC